MRVADYIFKTLADWGIKHVFLVTGGGAMHLNDGLRCEKRLTPVCCHHEQACAIAAEGYFRATGKMAAVNVTSGPGGTNALTGVAGQWLDSIPVVYISGQVKFETTIRSCPDLGLRQLGDQELNITDVVRSITKYTAFVENPKAIRKELEEAYYHAFNGRPGPVWLDIPLNVQGAEINESSLPGFIPPTSGTPVAPEAECGQILGMLQKAKRPVIIAGWGIRLSKAEPELLELVSKARIPVLTTFNGFDLIPSDHPLFSGRIGTLGQRAGNFVLQNADLVISIGSRNNIRQTGYNWESYCRKAKKVSVDIDPAELRKKNFVPDLAVCCDAKLFLSAFLKQYEKNGRGDRERWIQWCRERQLKNPAYTKEHECWSDRINPYHFMHILTEKMDPDMILAAGNGTACVALFQTGIVKSGQRLFWNSGCASMGYDLPAAIGASIASGKTTLCLAGDGSIMMNLQELQTMVSRDLPVKLFVLDNKGYSSIKQTQKNFFGDELMGCGPESGVSFPDFMLLAKAFGIPAFEAGTQETLPTVIDRVFSCRGPALCVVRLPDHFVFSPKISSRRLSDGTMISCPLEDMFPFMDRSEFETNMIHEE